MKSIEEIRNEIISEREERLQDKLITPNHFSIVQYIGYPVWTIWLMIVGFAFCNIVLLFTKELNILWNIIPTVFLLLSIYCLGETIWRIDVDEDTITYRNIVARRKTYAISDISRVVAIPKNGSAFDYKYKFYNEGKKLFTINADTDNVYLLQRLEERGVQVEKQ